MRIYMCGTISDSTVTEFIPTEVFLTSKDCTDSKTPSEKCIMLTGLWCEGDKGEDSEWECRWKGVEIAGEEDWKETKDKKFLLNLIKERGLSLADMNAYIGTRVEDAYISMEEKVAVRVKELVILDSRADEYGKETFLKAGLLEKELELNG